MTKQELENILAAFDYTIESYEAITTSRVSYRYDKNGKECYGLQAKSGKFIKNPEQIKHIVATIKQMYANIK